MERFKAAFHSIANLNKLRMNKITLTLIVTAALFATVFTAKKLSAADNAPTLHRYEFVTIRWAGRENTHLIRSNGKVEILGQILNQTSRPDRTDERTFYMNIAMNAVAREGFDVAAMTQDEIVMRRAIGR
jgi:hypothetical protein